MSKNSKESCSWVVMQQGSCMRCERHNGKFRFLLWPKAKSRNIDWDFQSCSRHFVDPDQL